MSSFKLSRRAMLKGVGGITLTRTQILAGTGALLHSLPSFRVIRGAESHRSLEVLVQAQAGLIGRGRPPVLSGEVHR